MEKKDRTITVSSHLHFISSASGLGGFSMAASANSSTVQAGTCTRD